MWFVGSEKPCIYSVPNRKQSYEIDNGTMIADYGEGNVTEKEPNSSKAASTKLALNVSCDGELGSYYKYRRDGADVDWYSVDLVQGQRYMIHVGQWNEDFAATTAIVDLYTPSNGIDSLGYYLEMYGQDYLYYTAPETGTYYFRLWNYLDSSSYEEHYYWLAVYDESHSW